MIAFLKKHKLYGLCLIVTIKATIFLAHIDFLRINPAHVIENIFFSLSLLFWAFILYLPIYKLNYLKANKHIVFKIIGLIVFFIVTLQIDAWFQTPDNPLTMLLLVTFWVSAGAIASPSFFKKYRYYIIAIYGLILSYFTYVRLFSESFESYANKHKEEVFLLLILPIPILMILWIYEQWRWTQSLKAGKAKAELDLLKTQINPHFFFNTLNNLYALTVKKSSEAPDVVLKLSEMMRYTIYEGKKDKVSLQDEVAYLNNYLSLHRIRYHKSVDISFTTDIIDTQQIAPLLFIIPLENAIKHGVETLSDAAYISMSLTSTAQSVRFIIENNFDPTIISSETGIGLTNLKHRLALTYPKKHHLSITKEKDTFKLVLQLTLDSH